MRGHLRWEGLRGGRDVLVGPKGRKGRTCHVLLTPQVLRAHVNQLYFYLLRKSCMEVRERVFCLFQHEERSIRIPP